MGAGASAETLTNASADEVKKPYEEQSPEAQQKLKQALAQMEGGNTSLAGPPSPQQVPGPSPQRVPQSKPMIEMLEQGLANCARCKDLKPQMESMFAGLDADANGKVSVSELGFAADMVCSAVEGIDSKEEIMKKFDKNGDGMLSKDELKTVAEGVALGLQHKMAEAMIMKGDMENFEDEDTKKRWETCKKQLQTYL